MFRQATLADIPFLLDLQDRPEFLPAFGSDDAEGWQNLIEAPERRVLIWCEGADPAGLALLTLGRIDPSLVELTRFGLASQNRGTGGRALEALFAYAFEELSAFRFYLHCAVDNLRAQRVYERAGMIHEGTLRQHWKRRIGDRSDLRIYGLLAEEWRESRREVAA